MMYAKKKVSRGAVCSNQYQYNTVFDAVSCGHLHVWQVDTEQSMWYAVVA